MLNELERRSAEWRVESTLTEILVIGYFTDLYSYHNKLIGKANREDRIFPEMNNPNKQKKKKERNINQLLLSHSFSVILFLAWEKTAQASGNLNKGDAFNGPPIMIIRHWNANYCRCRVVAVGKNAR